MPKPIERHRAGQGKNDYTYLAHDALAAPPPIPSGTQRRNDNTPGSSRLVSRHCRPRLGAGPCAATSYELNNLPLFFFTIKGYNVDKRFNQMSFSFSSPLFCCRVPGARHRVFCCCLGFLQAARQIGICRGERTPRTTLSFRTSAHTGVGISIEFQATYRHTGCSFVPFSGILPREVVRLTEGLPHHLRGLVRNDREFDRPPNFNLSFC